MTDLDQRLGDLTPPPSDEETILEEARALDAVARQELEDSGVPPCYPPNVAIPVTTNSLPEPHFGVVEYFEQIAPHSGAVLTSQLRMWKQFRLHQARTRVSREQSEFQRSKDRIHKRYRGWKGSSKCMLLRDHTKQSKMQNWTEYEELERWRMERLKHEKEHLEQKLAAAESAKGPCPDLVGFYNSLEYNERKRELQTRLLKWIKWEWRRIADLEKTCSRQPRSNVQVNSTLMYTQERYNLRPRINGRVLPFQTHSAGELHIAPESTGLLKTKSGRVSKRLTW